MTVPEIIEKLKDRFPDGIRETLVFRGDYWIRVDNEVHYDLMKSLKEEYGFNFLMDVVGVDYPRRKERIEVIYNLYSLGEHLRLFVKIRAGGDIVPRSVTDLWPSANWMEREVFDMLGVQFANHPDLRRILMRDDFPWHPLRKDFQLTSDEIDFGVPIRTKPPKHIKDEPDRLE